MASTMSLIVTPSRLPIALTSATSSVALAKGAAGRYDVIEEGCRRMEVAGQSGYGPGLAPHSPNPLRGIPHEAGEFTQMLDVIPHREPDQLRIGRDRVRAVVVVLGLRCVGQIHSPCHEVGRCDAVG